MKLSQHLDLSEVTRSESAKRNGISNMPTKEHIANFMLLAEKIFEPIREHFGVPIRISSGYRSKELNEKIGGSSTSQHSSGEALDIDMDGTSISNKQIFDYIKDNLEFDQLINEFNYSWVHVSYKSTGKQRKQILEAYKDGGASKYKPYEKT
ncbi:Peptidase M15A, C-terminal [uncultured Caudovirales phage]|uniref:Peptidase M15A, C-terminal n=1 Tax=uncultured Caudovirales phage TaxID=2100421 RepID=A0A6J5PUN8_9CAUD|nr:Peptidase M15A, C-terminal [uncultured Caudovirales phage]